MRKHIRCRNHRIRRGQEIVIDDLLLLHLMCLRRLDQLLRLSLLLGCMMQRSMTGHHSMYHACEHVCSALQLGCHVSNGVETDDETWVVSS